VPPAIQQGEIHLHLYVNCAQFQEGRIQVHYLSRSAIISGKNDAFRGVMGLGFVKIREEPKCLCHF
jgi:hypothetical protein